MIKILTVIFLISISLLARENPFFPSDSEEDMPFTTNKEVVEFPLKRATITLPSSARTLESVTIKYKNLDGSIVETTEELGNSVDWHLPIFISQNIEESTTTVNQVEKKKTKKKKYTSIFSMKFIRIVTHKREIKIETKDKLIRDFLLTNPHRIVCDFKRDINIRSLEKKIKKNSCIQSLRIGNHKGYYRVVIELDGHYKYQVSQSKNSYEFLLL